ncbi:MAG: carboxylate-amine ligase [Candidatus Kapabacteria bacterium]|nr:carboxylate-amine ligase [Candidatus Kapabacteria bacterium]
MKIADQFSNSIKASNPYERPAFTIGIEEEYMVLDPQTFDLRSHINLELLSKGRMILHEHVKPEMHGSMLEIGTGVCRNVKEAHFEVTKIRSIVAHLARQNGLLIGAASTHPFAKWQDQEIHPDEHYQNVVRDMQMLARSLLIFGMHIHIGIENRETQIQIMNVIRYFLPHILAISTNSPFWMGMDTGLKSYRSKIFERFPRTNLPDYFASWGEYESYVDLLIRTGCIDNPKKIWWDIRPHPKFPTLEIRICDLPMRVDETIAIVALCQALAVKLFSLYEKNLTFRTYPRMLLMENKWRAVRYGLEGKLIDFGRQQEYPAKDLVRELLEFVDDVVDDLGSRRYIEYIYQILEMGSGADRQLRVFKETGSIERVVEYINQESMTGLITDVSPYLATTFREPSADAIQEKMSSLTPPNDII